MKLKKLCINLFICIFIITFFALPVGAEEDIINMNSKTNVLPNHLFTITFNKDLDSSTVNDKYINITDLNNKYVSGIKVSIDKKDSKKVIITAPDKGYGLGKTYYINIGNGVKNSKGKSLKKTTKMKFTVKSTLSDGATASVEKFSSPIMSFTKIKILSTTLPNIVSYKVESQSNSPLDDGILPIKDESVVFTTAKTAIIHFYDSNGKEIASGILGIDKPCDNVSFKITQ